MVDSLYGLVSNGGAENAGVENAGVIMRIVRRDTIRYQ